MSESEIQKSLENGEANEESQEAEMGFLDHLEELRWRLIKSVIVVFVFAILAFWQSEKIIQFLMYPISKLNPRPQIIFLKPAGIFLVRMTVAAVAGVIGALPVIFYQLWNFVAPGLYRKEKKFGIVFIFSTVFCFVTGFSFAFFIILPNGLQFLLNLTIEGITPQLNINEYISFVVQMVVVFGMVFELPVITVSLAKIGLITSDTLKAIRPYALIIIFIVAALITPPDVFTQTMLALPLFLLFELSILLTKMIKT